MIELNWLAINIYLYHPVPFDVDNLHNEKKREVVDGF
jgi:hypothetical protein